MTLILRLEPDGSENLCFYILTPLRFPPVKRKRFFYSFLILFFLGFPEVSSSFVPSGSGSSTLRSKTRTFVGTETRDPGSDKRVVINMNGDFFLGLVILVLKIFESKGSVNPSTVLWVP